MLVYDASLDDDPELVEAVAAAAAITLDDARLQTESRERLGELRASRERLVAASDAERRRLERNLHDGAQPRVGAGGVPLRVLRGRGRGWGPWRPSCACSSAASAATRSWPRRSRRPATSSPGRWTSCASSRAG